MSSSTAACGMDTCPTEQSVVQIQIEHVQEYPHPSSLQVVPDVLQRQDFHVQFSGIRDDAGTNNKLVIV